LLKVSSSSRTFSKFGAGWLTKLEFKLICENLEAKLLEETFNIRIQKLEILSELTFQIFLFNSKWVLGVYIIHDDKESLEDIKTTFNEIFSGNSGYLLMMNGKTKYWSFLSEMFLKDLDISGYKISGTI
jgi:hypothetical protein